MSSPLSFPHPLPTEAQIAEVVARYADLGPDVEPAVRLFAATRTAHASALEVWEQLKPARSFFVQYTDEQRAAKAAVTATWQAAYDAERAMDQIAYAIKGAFLQMWEAGQ